MIETFLKTVESVVKIPAALKDPIERRRLRNDTILSSLRNVGVATYEEIQQLQDRVAELEATVKRIQETLVSGPTPGQAPGATKDSTLN